MMRLAATMAAAFTAGFVITLWRNTRKCEHNTITGTGKPVP